MAALLAQKLSKKKLGELLWPLAVWLWRLLCYVVTLYIFLAYLPVFCLVSSAHPFIKKEWYNVRVPSNFDISAPTLTPCNKAAGQSK